MNLYNMTKEELISLYRKLKAENEALQGELNDLSDCYTEMENQLADRMNILDSLESISDVNWFKFKLDLEGLLTPQLESFIEDYMKFNNIVKG